MNKEECLMKELRDLNIAIGFIFSLMEENDFTELAEKYLHCARSHTAPFAIYTNCR